MARKRSKKQNRPPRDTFDTRYQPVRVVVGPRPMRWMSPLPPTKIVTADRRQWHPERWGQPVVATRRAAARIVVPPKPGPVLTSRLAFSDPKRVLVCHRRKTRREVIHALGKAGGGNASPRRKPTSEIQC